MGKKEKEKKRKKKERKALELLMPKDCKPECCEKYKKREDKRCKRCPMFDLLHKVA